MNRSYLLAFALCILVLGCTKPQASLPIENTLSDSPFLVVLGIAQDAGYPQAGCYQKHCMRAWKNPALKRKATCLALVDPREKKKWLFEATPDLREQLYELEQVAPDSLYQLEGIFLTHGHMGHYTGLMYLGRESMNTHGMKVYAMPRMHTYLSTHGPWEQLVNINNISLIPLADSTLIKLSPGLSVVPFSVPHRDEYTETVGYQIFAQGKSIIFIPDIDKWNLWEVNLAAIHPAWDYAFLDATFYRDGELPGRDMSKIRHPFVTESFTYFEEVPADKKSNIHFIHFNHTNPLLIEGSDAQREVLAKGFNYAYEGQIIRLTRD